MSAQARRFSKGLHGRSPSISPRPVNSFSANLLRRFGSFSRISQMLSMVARIAPVWLFSSSFAAQPVSYGGSSSVSFPKSFMADSARSLAMSWDTFWSATASSHIAR